MTLIIKFFVVIDLGGKSVFEDSWWMVHAILKARSTLATMSKPHSTW